MASGMQVYLTEVSTSYMNFNPKLQTGFNSQIPDQL